MQIILGIEDEIKKIILNKKCNFYKLKNKKVFLTGCTGFFGIWILGCFYYANKILNLNTRIYCLSRKQKNISKFKKYFPKNNFKFLIGDISKFNFRDLNVDYIIHGATTSAFETYSKIAPIKKYVTIVNGTQNILNFAEKIKCKNFLYLSSGAVYGLNNKKNKINENYNFSINNLKSDKDKNLLGESKIIAENIVMARSKLGLINANIARCFSFVGPFIPLNLHYAVGNFLNGAVNNKKIKINNKNNYRSYLYMSDLCVALFSIFLGKKSNYIYNVGSDNAISIENLAKKVTKITGKDIFHIKKKEKKKFSYYVPNIGKLKKEFNFKINNNLSESLLKTYNHIKNYGKFYE